MSRQAETSWSFFVDESGHFGDRDDAVAVAGVVVREGLPGGSPAEVRRSLELALPEFPWPLHAKNVNQPAYVAVAWRVRAATREAATGDAAGRLVRLEPAVSDAVAYLDRVAPRLFAEAVGKMERGGEPNYTTLDELSRLLRQYRTETYEVLADAAGHAWSRVRDVLEALGLRPDEPPPARARAGRPRATDRPGTGTHAGTAHGAAHGAINVTQPGCFIVAASETEDGDAMAGAGLGAIDARYFTLLGTVVERAARVLGARGGRHRLLLHVLTRHVQEPALGRPVPLTPAHVGKAVTDTLGGFGDAVRVTPAVTSKFNESVSGPFVLADFVANRSRWALAETRRALAEAEREMARRLAAPVRSGAQPRSHLAASGRAADLIRRAPLAPGEEPRALLPLDPSFKRWACEQAWEWAAP